MNKKLSPHERRAIARLRNSGVRRATVAAAFGVHPSTVTRIQQGTWVSGHGDSRVRGVAVPLVHPFRELPWSHA